MPPKENHEENEEKLLHYRFINGVQGKEPNRRSMCLVTRLNNCLSTISGLQRAKSDFY